MLTTAAMELLNIVVLKDKAEEIMSYLLKKNVFQPLDLQKMEVAVASLTPYQMEAETCELDLLEAELRELSRRTGLAIELNKELEPLGLDKTREIIKKLDREIAPLVADQTNLEEGIRTKETMLAKAAESFALPARKSGMYSFIEMALGRIETKNLQLLERSLAELPHMAYPVKEEGKKIIVLVVILRRDRALLEKVLKDVAWEKVDYPKGGPALSNEIKQIYAKEIGEAKTKIQALAEQIRAAAGKYTNDLERARLSVAIKRALLEAKKVSYVTAKTMLLPGWIPREEKDEVLAAIRKIEETALLRGDKAEEVNLPPEDVPVLFKNNFIIKPFELLINSYGVPCYGTLDPTAFVAIAFLLMFGTMFGDLGQGLVLAALGVLLWRGKSPMVKQAGTLIFYCGSSAAVFGLLFGSVFGFEFHPFWMRPIDNITELFKAAIIFGIIVISSGILFNVTNAVRTRDLGKLLFDKAGLVAGLIYWIGIAIALKIFVSQTAIPPVFLYTIGAGVLVILFKPLLEILFRHKKEKDESLALAMAESSVDLLEIVMGYLANTVSFIRVAAFALAHAGLFIAVFQLAKLVSGWGGSQASYILIALGNVGIIALEGLLVTIQSVRLNYYEFFSKFFISGKQEFKPLSL